MGDHLPRSPHPARLHHLIPPQPKHSAVPLPALATMPPFGVRQLSCRFYTLIRITNRTPAPPTASYRNSLSIESQQSKLLSRLMPHRRAAPEARQTFCQVPFPSQVPPPTAS